jgi:lipopolysaccharide transport system permease protein
MSAPASLSEHAQGFRPIIVRPSGGWIPIDARAIWEYRELLYFLTWRDVKVRYKQTVLGVAWAIIQPVFSMVVFSVFLGRLAGVPSDSFPYPLFTYCGLLPWQLFSAALTQSGNSLVASQNLITKVYFPRLVIPLSAVLGGLVDFGVAFLVLLALFPYYGLAPRATVVFLPLFVALAVMAALAVGVWLAALNVQYRDVRYAIPFLSQLWLFATPVAYPSSLLSEPWRVVYGLNPMVGVVDGFRWSVLGGEGGPGWGLVVSIVVTIGLLVTGLYYFRRMEATFADVV